VLKDGCHFNQRYRAHLHRRLEWEDDRTGELRAALYEAVRLNEIYDSAWGAHPEYHCSPEVKACYLRKLRVLIGREAYQRGELPSCVPLHRFNQLKW
jgi:hypothetical protein